LRRNSGDADARLRLPNHSIAMKQKKTLSHWLTTRYLVIVREEENFAEKMTLNMTLSKLFLGVGAVFILTSALSYLLVTTILARWADPRAQMLQTKEQLRTMNAQIDSLTQMSASSQIFIANVQRIVEGRIPNADAPLGQEGEGLGESKSDSIDLSATSPIDSMFRKQFEEGDYDALVLKNTTKEALQQVYFFSPVKGVISDVFNAKKRHYGVDVVARKDEPIKAVADGSVIMASWTQDAGYVLALQHRNQLVSFYKHNSMLLREVGDMVKAGEAIAIIGNSGEYTDGPHLHFELWYEGNPVDPEDFVHF
jgi:murein DD-endopeptidase MepM/ murein hydrolase activator NlpD